jgi:hypothetical protein
VSDTDSSSNLGPQFPSNSDTVVGPLGNSIGEHSSSVGATSTDAAQGQYMGKHRKSHERWNPQAGVPGFDEARYQRTWGSSPVGGGSDEPQNISPVQFTGGLGTTSKWDD